MSKGEVHGNLTKKIRLDFGGQRLSSRFLLSQDFKMQEWENVTQILNIWNDSG